MESGCLPVVLVQQLRSVNLETQSDVRFPLLGAGKPPQFLEELDFVGNAVPRPIFVTHALPRKGCYRAGVVASQFVLPKETLCRRSAHNEEGAICLQGRALPRPLETDSARLPEHKR